MVKAVRKRRVTKKPEPEMFETRVPRADTSEKAISGQWGYSIPGMPKYNPDDLIVAKGKSVKVYQDMAREPYVKAALHVKKMEVVSYPWKIVPAGDDTQSAEIADTLQNNLNQLEGQTMGSVLWGMMDALDTGYSIAEKVMIQRDGRYDYLRVKSIDTYYYTFDTDEFGNIKKIVYDKAGLGLGRKSSGGFDPRFFIVFSHMAKYNNPYGNSELRAAHRAFTIKEAVWRFRAMYLERFGVPSLIGKVPDGSHKDVRDEMLKVLKQVQAESNIVIRKSDELEVMKIGTSPNNEYESAINSLNKDILIGILGSFMEVDEGTNTGARALGEVHHDVSKKASQFLSMQLADTLTEQLVIPWVDINYGKVDRYPTFQFLRDDDFDKYKESLMYLNLSKAGVRIGLKHAYDRFKIPVPEDGEEVLQPPENVPGGYENVDKESDHFADDSNMIRVRQEFWPRLSALFTDIASKAFNSVKSAEVLKNGDLVKAKDMGLGINVSAIKAAYADVMIFGNLIGRGAKVDVAGDRDAMLYEAGMDSATFSETIHRYDSESHRLAGVFKKGAESCLRAEVLRLVATNATEAEAWSGINKTLITKLGIDNYTDAPDVEALSIGYNDGLKARHGKN